MTFDASCTTFIVGAITFSMGDQLKNVSRFSHFFNLYFKIAFYMNNYISHSLINTQLIYSLSLQLVF
jgi:hypothetical protein